MLVREGNKVCRKESNDRQLKTINSLVKFLKNYCDEDLYGDIMSSEGLGGVHDPSEGYSSLTFKAKKRGGYTVIECYMPDYNELSLGSSFVEDVVDEYKNDSYKGEETLVNIIAEHAMNNFLDNYPSKDFKCDEFILPVSEGKVKDIIRLNIEEFEDHISNKGFSYYNEIKEHIEGSGDDMR